MKKLLLTLVFVGISVSSFAQTYGSRWRIALDGGYSRRLSQLSPDIDEFTKSHLKKLLGGLNAGLEATFFVAPNLGIGLKAYDFRASNEEYATATFDDGRQETGYLKETVDIAFAGPIATYRGYDREGNNAFIMSYGYGLAFWQDNASFVDENSNLKGVSTASYVFLGYDFRITEKFAAGVGISAMAGSVKIDEDTTEGLLHANLTLGLRLNL